MCDAIEMANRGLRAPISHRYDPVGEVGFVDTPCGNEWSWR
jgi:hypothetical protein